MATSELKPFKRTSSGQAWANKFLLSLFHVFLAPYPRLCSVMHAQNSSLYSSSVSATDGVEYAGPFAPSLNGDTTILIYIEHFTEWIELVPLKDQTGLAGLPQPKLPYPKFLLDSVPLAKFSSIKVEILEGNPTHLWINIRSPTSSLPKSTHYPIG